MPESSHITTSGGLLTQAFIDFIRESSTDRPHTEPAAFGVPWESAPATDKKLEDDVAGAWELLKERWDAVVEDAGGVDELSALDVSTTRQRWLLPLLQLLDFDPQYQRKDLRPTGDEDLRFDVSHRGWNGETERRGDGEAGKGATDDGPALHLLAPGQDLDQRQNSGRGPKAKSPHDMLQVFLNVSEPDLWAVLSNGRFLRLLRDYHHTFSKGYVQFDLESIFEGRNYADFRALYRLCHASRFRPTSDAEEATLPLEDFHQTARATGVKIGEDLRPQVRDAIQYLGNGFLQGDPDLIDALQGDPDAARDFYSEILRVVYRILFLLFAEQRGLVPDSGAPRSELYWSDYSLTALREEAERGVPERDDYTDLWHGLQTTFRMVRDGAEELGVFGYNGELFDLSGEDYLEGRACDNARLLRAVRALTLIEREGVLQRISYLDLGVEELGSIYEALLDYTPRVTEEPEEIEATQIRANTFVLDPRGLERKQSGSYYTPDSLVNELVKSALLPVMRDRLQDAGLPVVDEDALGEVTTGLLQEYADLSEKQREAGEEALLSMTVCDPAAGSGHFLVKGNDVLGAEVARLRSGDEYPTERRIREAKREVLARCIYAVDLNPMAVELCKVSLWINASVDNRPLNFLDHHIKCGNSLIGATPELLEDSVPYEAFDHTRSGTHRERAKDFRKQNRTERRESKEGIGVQLGAFAEGMTTEPGVEYRAGDFVKLAQTNPKKAREVYQGWSTDPSRQKSKLEADAWTAAFFWPIDEDTTWAPTYREVFRLRKEGPDAIPGDEAERIRALAREHRFFHWHLEFPDVFDEDGDGGFDVVLGNPPWERVKFQREEFLAVKRPDIVGKSTASKRKEAVKELKEKGDPIYEEYEKARHFSAAMSTYFSECGRYEFGAAGDTNTYPLFTELATHITTDSGRSGIIVKTGIISDYHMRHFFAHLIDSNRLVSAYDFSNRKELFEGVERNERFTLLTLAGPDSTSDTFEISVLNELIDDLSDQSRRWNLTRKEAELINPNTKTCPLFEYRSDAKITSDIYKSVSVLVNEHDEESNPWSAKYFTMFHMTNDSGKFVELEDFPEQVEASRKVDFQGTSYKSILEGKLFDIHDCRYGDFRGVPREARFRTKAEPNHADSIQKKDPSYRPLPRYWITSSTADSAYKEKLGYVPSGVLTFRDVCRTNTDRRTVRACINPPEGAGNKAPLLIFPGVEKTEHAYRSLLLVSNMGSLPFDYVARQKFSGGSLNKYILIQLPFLEPHRYTEPVRRFLIPRILELTYSCWSLAAFADDVWSEASRNVRDQIEYHWQQNAGATDGGHEDEKQPGWVERSNQAAEKFPFPPFMWESSRRHQLRSEIDGLYAHMYGLSRDELRYVLDKFPILKDQEEEEYGEYRTKRLVLETYDELAGTDLVDDHGATDGPYILTDVDLHDLDEDAERDAVEDAFNELQEEVDEAPSLTDDSERQKTTTTSRSRSEAFRVGVRKLYDHRCAVCGVRAHGPGDGSAVVDAAHIYPKGEGGADDLRNGLCLCKNHHWAFDEGWFTVTDDHTVRVHPDLPSDSDHDFIREHDGEDLHLPEDERFHPHPVFLEARRELQERSLTPEDAF